MLRPSRSRRFHRAGEGLPALCGATPFRARALRRCGGCLLLSPGTRITRLSPFAGAETSTTRLAVQGTAGPFAINFSRPFRCRFIRPKKISRSPPDICTGPCSFTPLRRTALKRVKVISRGQVQQVPAQSQNRGPGNSTGDGLKFRSN
ncbi:single-stranded DNA-binding protein (plasmid) [Klebsiella pneumoniae]|nr:single-stranded DNA-binding protein [Klebsiella pneumoniae]